MFARAALTCTCLALSALPAVAQTVFHGPTGPYLEASDSPYAALSFEYFHLEDHEDGAVNTPGLSVDIGSLLIPGGNTDSVDADDGTLDGLGREGYSWFLGLGSLTVTYTFDAAVLGDLPTHVGLVHTNAFPLVISVEAFDGNDVSLGSSAPADLPAIMTANAVFVGAEHDDGIRRFAVTFTFMTGFSTIEVDHVQYGSILVLPTTTTSTSTSTSSTSSTTIPPLLIGAKKLLVKQKKSGRQKVIILAKDPAVAAANPCNVAGSLIIEALGSGTAAVPYPLDAADWKPIKRNKPEKGCKYRKGPVVATVLLKTGKLLKVVASSTDLEIPLGADPSPVRIEVRHGDVRHCMEFPAGGTYVADKKLLVKAPGPPAGCPSIASPSGAFVR